jgi:hypothetical protein
MLQGHGINFLDGIWSLIVEQYTSDKILMISIPHATIRY